MKKTKGMPSKIERLQKQARDGDAESQLDLAIAYYRGRGIERNLTKAFEYCLASAMLGNSVAQHNIGLSYTFATGTKKNLKKAFQWFEKSAAQKYAPSISSLGNAILEVKVSKKILRRR